MSVCLWLKAFTLFTAEKSGPPSGHSFGKSLEMPVSCFEEHSSHLHNMLPLVVTKQTYLLSTLSDFHHAAVSS